MASPYLTLTGRPRLTNATMLLALTGWMDGGFVSTGTVRELMEGRPATEFARIDSDPFYIYNFPGSMEIAAVFRPDVKYEGGVVQRLEMPSNIFYADSSANLVFFLGKEPNLRWESFSEAVFEAALAAGVTRIMFIGSFGGTVPHTREPRLYGSASESRLTGVLEDNGLRMSDYEGPASFSTLLLQQSRVHGIEMMSLVAEIPGYLQGVNPLSIEAITRRLGKILNLPVDVDKLRKASDQWEVQVTEAVEKDEKLAATVRKLEERYDNELINPGAAMEMTEEEEGENDE